MNLLEFVDKHLLFSLLVAFLLTCLIDNMWSNFLKTLTNLGILKGKRNR